MKEFSTKDLGEAGALLAKGLKLLRLEEIMPRQFYFIFEGNNADNLSNSYWSGELLVSAKEYNDALRTLKDRMFARK